MPNTTTPIVWTDSYGRSWTMESIEDTHLVNIIKHLKERSGSPTEFILEANRRGLSQDFRDRAEIPHRHPKTNQWMLFDKNSGRPQPVGK